MTARRPGERVRLTISCSDLNWERSREIADRRGVSINEHMISAGLSYVLLLDAGGRTKRVSLGPVGVKSLEEVRRECHARRANPEPETGTAPARLAPLFVSRQ